MVKISGQSDIYTTTLTKYINGDDKISIAQRGEKKEIVDNFELGKSSVNCAYNCGLEDNMIRHLQKAITSKITTTECNNKECYMIEADGITLWVDKDTGLVYREMNGLGVAEFSYEFDVVSDDDIVKPTV